MKKMPEWKRRFAYLGFQLASNMMTRLAATIQAKQEQVRLGNRNIRYRKKTRGVRRIIREKNALSPEQRINDRKKKPSFRPPSAEFVDYGSCVKANK
jgi:hypothetical protein